MAITNTRAVQRIETYPPSSSSAASSLNAGNPTLMVVYQHTFDDSSDAELPVTTDKVKHLQRYTITVADDGTESSAATDVTGEDQLVQDICGAIWA